MSDLPAYSPAPLPPPPTRATMAGSIQTCSFKDQQSDYFRITRNSGSSGHISLTVNERPLYLVQTSPDPSFLADIRLLTVFSPEAPVAACRILPKPSRGVKKGDPFATLCTSHPSLPSAQWRPIRKASALAYHEDYSAALPIVIVPGCKPVMCNVSWRLAPRLSPNPMEADVELWLKEPLPFTAEVFDSVLLLARYYDRNTRIYEKGTLEIRRGCGIDFEYGAVLGIFAALELAGRK